MNVYKIKSLYFGYIFIMSILNAAGLPAIDTSGMNSAQKGRVSEYRVSVERAIDNGTDVPQPDLTGMNAAQKQRMTAFYAAATGGALSRASSFAPGSPLRSQFAASSGDQDQQGSPQASRPVDHMASGGAGLAASGQQQQLAAAAAQSAPTLTAQQILYLQRDAAFARSAAATELQQLIALANPATMQATVDQRIRAFAAVKLEGYSLDVNAQKAGVVDRPAANTAQGLVDWLAPKVSAAMTGKIKGADGSVADLVRFSQDVSTLLSSQALIAGDAKNRGMQPLVKAICTSHAQADALLTNGASKLSIKDFTDQLAKYVAFVR